MTGEQWRAVIGWDGFYEVSDHGRVRSVDRVVAQSNGVHKRLRGRVLCQALAGREPGHWKVGLRRNGEQDQRYVAALVAEAFIGSRPPRQQVRHRDDNRDDNRPENLQYGTDAENKSDSVRNGRHRNAGKTDCPRGHRLVAPNLIYRNTTKPDRQCRSCANAHRWLSWHGQLTPEAWQAEADRRYGLLTLAG